MMPAMPVHALAAESQVEWSSTASVLSGSAEKTESSIASAETKEGVTTYFETLQEAVDSVKAGGVVTLLDNCSGGGVVVEEDAKFVLDLNNFTYTINDKLVGSSGTQTNGFQLLRDGSVTIKNGSIESSIAKILIQNYSNLTLDNVNLISHCSRGYVLSNNCGDVVIRGSKLTAPSGGVAFDVYYWPNGGYDDGVSVTVEGDSKIIGNVGYGGDGTATDVAEYAKLNIAGGTFNGTLSIGELGGSDKAGVNITGGNLSGFDVVSNGSSIELISFVQPGMTLDEGGSVIIDDTAAEASVDGVGFVSLQEAIDSIQGKGEVTLLKNVTEDVEIRDDKSVSIDLGGKKVTNVSGHTFTVRTGSSLEVKGEGTVDNVTHAKASIWNEGSVKLNGGKYTRSLENGLSSTDAGENSYYVIVNHGVMEISNGVTVEQDGHFSSMIENGYYSYNSENSDSGYVSGTNDANPKLTITGGVFDGGLNTVKNDDGGILEIEGGTFKNVSQAALSNWNVTTILGGFFESESYCVLNGGGDEGIDKGDLTITGGEFVAGNGKSAISAMNGNPDYLENVQVSGGAFSSDVKKFLTKEVQYVVTSSQPDRFSYFKTLDAALEAAEPGDDIESVNVAAADQVTLTLKFNDEATNESVFAVVEGTSVKLPVPVRDGYDFLGWYDQAGNKAGENYDVNANSVLTAKWNSKSPGGGGGVVVESYDVAIGEFADGKVTSDVAKAEEGDKVTLTVAPDAGYELEAIAVVGPDGEEVELTANADGTYSFEMPDFDVEVKASFACDGEELCPSHKFEDVDQDEWYHDAIDWAVSNKVLNGFDDTGLMMPDGEVTRAQMAQILWNVEGRPAVSEDPGFSDVADSDWFDGAVAWAASEGIFEGYDGTDSFGPNDVLTREQAAAVLMRWTEANGGEVDARADLSGYPDASSVDEWAVEYVSWAVAAGVISGVEQEDGTLLLDPLGTATRAQTAMLMMRLVEA